MTSSLANLPATSTSQLLPGVFTTADATADGYASDEIRRLVDRGEWMRLRRGAYATASTWSEASDEQRHLLLSAAIQATVSQPIATSHYSAAIAHRLPLIRRLPNRPHLTANREHFRSIPGARLFNGALHAGHTQLIDGLLTTTPARTISDIARTRALADAIVMLEHGLRTGLLASADVAEVVKACPTWRGIAWTKRVVLWAEPRNETVGESLSHFRMRERELPLPACQVEVGVDGRLYRLDYLWPHLGVAGEFDGRLKYENKDALWAEKRREDDLRSIGLSVARWGWDDVRVDGTAMERVIRRAFERGAAASSVTWRAHVVSGLDG